VEIDRAARGATVNALRGDDVSRAWSSFSLRVLKLLLVGIGCTKLGFLGCSPESNNFPHPILSVKACGRRGAPGPLLMSVEKWY
jgi:hypothetical protein